MLLLRDITVKEHGGLQCAWLLTFFGRSRMYSASFAAGSHQFSPDLQKNCQIFHERLSNRFAKLVELSGVINLAAHTLLCDAGLCIKGFWVELSKFKSEEIRFFLTTRFVASSSRIWSQFKRKLTASFVETDGQIL
jgi:hypothetical protein